MSTIGMQVDNGLHKEIERLRAEIAHQQEVIDNIRHNRSNMMSELTRLTDERNAAWRALDGVDFLRVDVTVEGPVIIGLDRHIATEWIRAYYGTRESARDFVASEKENTDDQA